MNEKLVLACSELGLSMQWIVVTGSERPGKARRNNPELSLAIIAVLFRIIPRGTMTDR